MIREISTMSSVKKVVELNLYCLARKEKHLQIFEKCEKKEVETVI
jgi:hypothetical protein